LSVISCNKILGSVREFIQSNNFSQLDIQSKQIDLFLLKTAYLACNSLSELKSLSNEDLITDEISLLEDWVDGISVNTLGKHFKVSDTGTALSEYLADRIMYKLPWGFNSFIHILTYASQQKFEDLPISWQHLPSMIKFGVNNVVACWACSISTMSRSMALQIAQQYPSTVAISFADFISWLVNLSTEHILYNLNGTIYEKLNLIQRISNIIVDDAQSSFIRYREPIIAQVNGIRYRNTHAAYEVTVGDSVDLEFEVDNPYDAHAVKVIWNRQHLGYIQRDRARIVSRELQLGYKASTHISMINKKPELVEPMIEITVRFSK
jgi:hypothetical protein